jgi:signal transduction histidine kinase/CheY-like chemotaxis protein
MNHLDSVIIKQRLSRAERLITGLSDYAGNLPYSRIEETVQPSRNNITNRSSQLTLLKLAIQEKDSSDEMIELLARSETPPLPAVSNSPANSDTVSSFDGSEPTSTIMGLQPDENLANLEINSQALPTNTTNLDQNQNQDEIQNVLSEHFALLSEAAGITRDALNLDGLVFLDAITSRYRGRSITKPLFIRHSSHSSSPAFAKVSMINQGQETQSRLLASSFKAARRQDQQNLSAIPDSDMQKLLSRFPQGAVFSADESGPINDQFGPGVKIDRNQNCESNSDKSDEAILFKLTPEAKYLLFVPLWHAQRECWFAAMLGWVTDASQRLDQKEVHLLTALGHSVVSKIAFAEAQTMSRVKSDFISSISHELRSPLHGIMATAELLRDQISDAATMGLVDMIDSCGSTLLDTFNNLLDHAKILHPTSKNDPEDTTSIASNSPTGNSKETSTARYGLVDLGHLVEEVVEIVTLGHNSVSAIQKGSVCRSSTSTLHSESNESTQTVLVTVNIEPGIDWTLRLETGSWRRIIMNLVGNSLKYTESGVIEVTLTTVPTIDESQGTDICFSVRDTGIGISHDYLRYHLFTSFSQENAMMPGTGLGLSIVKQLVQRLGGKIEVNSQKNIGTLIEVRVPFNKTTNERSPIVEKSQTLAQSLEGLELCLITEPYVGTDVKTIQRGSALQTTFGTIAESFGMIFKFAAVEDEPPTADIYFIDEGLTSHMNPDLTNRMKQHLKRLSPLIVVHPGLLSNIDLGSDQNGVQIPLSHPIGPKKIKKTILGSLQKKYELEQIECSRENDSQYHAIQKERKKLTKLTTNRQRPNITPKVSYSGTPLSPSSIKETSALHVLLVDDNSVNLRLLVALMDKLGHNFETATDGLQALNLYKSSIGTNGKPFDVIFMDISMPIMNGFESTREIRLVEENKSWPSCHIVALTGLGSEAAQIEASVSGLDLFLKKPVKLKEIELILSGLQEGKHT